MEKIKDKRFREYPRKFIVPVRLNIVEYKLIKKYFGSLTGLRNYGLAVIKKAEAEGKAIEKP